MKLMNPAPLSMGRKLLQVAEAETISRNSSRSPAANARDLRFHPIINGSSSSAAVAEQTPFNPSTTFDSSMALTILVLLTALFFMGFFSIYIRCFAAPDPSPAEFRRHPPPVNRKRGLDSSAVNSLPLVAYGKAGKHPLIDDCPICLSEFEEKESVKLIPYCGHVFHPKCIDTWLSSHVTCPLCRSAQLFKRAEEVDLV